MLSHETIDLNISRRISNMGQGTDTWQNETNSERNRKYDRKKDESATGRDIPGGDGSVGDEQVNAISSDPTGKPTGQDHSTENHEKTDPDHGVGEFQDRDDTMSDVARLRD
jgi:hypothetical protein